MIQTKAKLWHKDFTLVVIGQIISLFGNAVLRFALPLYILEQSGSPALCFAPIGIGLLLGVSAMVGYVIFTVSCFFAMIAGVMMRVQLFAFIQPVVPEEMMGKVFSCLMAIILCAQPVGQWLAGWSFERFADLPWVVLLAATALTGIVGVYSRSCFHKIVV